jgi:hypothetical protein
VKHRPTIQGLFLALVVSCAASGQTATPPSGHWEGTLQVPGQELKVEVDLRGTGSKWEGTISVPAQSLKGFPLAAISVAGDKVTFAMKGIPGDPVFNGTLAKDGKTMSGDFSQGGGTIPLSLTRTGEAKIDPLPKSTPITKELEGSWEGTLDINGKTLRLVFKLSNASGAGAGTLVSVDQGGAEIPIAAIVQSDAHVQLLLPAIAGSYEGDLKDAQLTGKWTQGGSTWPLALKRSK